MSTAQVQIVLRLKDQLSGAMRQVAGSARGFASGLGSLFQTLQRNWLALIAVFAMLRGVIRLFGDVTNAAIEQERAITSLNAALAAQGQYTRETSQALQDYATELQLLVGVGDETTLSIMTQIEALSGLSAQALPDAMRAVVQLANVTGMEYESAGKLMAKTLTAQTNALSRYGIEIDTTGSAQDKLNQILAKTAAGWDIAIAKAKTFEGRLTILKSVYGDLKEVIGANITQSGALNTLMTELTRTIFNQTKQLVQHGEQGVNAFDVLLKGAVNLASGIIKAYIYISTGLKTVVIAARFAIMSIKGAVASIAGLLLTGLRTALTMAGNFINRIIDLVNKAIGAINKLPGMSITQVSNVSVSFAGLDGAIAGFGATAADAYGDFAALSGEFENMGVSANLALWEVDRINTAVQNSKQSVIDYSNATKGAADALDKVGGAAGGAAGKVKDLADQYKNASVVIQKFIHPDVRAALGLERDVNKGVMREFPKLITDAFQSAFERPTAFDFIAAENKQREEVIAQLRDMGFAMAEVIEIIDGPGGLNAALAVATRKVDERPTRFQKFGGGVGDFLMQLGGMTGGGRGLGDAVSQIAGQAGGGFLGSAIGGLFGGTTTGGLMGMLGGAAGPLAMFLGPLLGGGLSKLFGGLFGGKKSRPEPVEIRGKVEIINLEDLALVMLGISTRSRISAASAGVNTRMNDIARQADRLGLGVA